MKITIGNSVEKMKTRQISSLFLFTSQPANHSLQCTRIAMQCHRITVESPDERRFSFPATSAEKHGYVEVFVSQISPTIGTKLGKFTLSFVTKNARLGNNDVL